MVDAALLLGDLQAELKRFVADLEVRVGEEPAISDRLDAEWKEAFTAERTGRTFEWWLLDRLTQVAVGWLLAGVFVRFCEDNRLLPEPAIAGDGDRGGAARAAQQRFFVAHPHDSDREYLHHVFAEAALLPGLGGVLGRDESPLWLVDPPADACTRLVTLFRATDENGSLRHDFTDADLDTRFLGDLYQDLSEQARDDYALLQTPAFVEEFILDRTLTPALDTFGLSRTTLIDPTCGSGHFLLGAFDRLWRAWRAAEPGTQERVLAQRALAAVTGVDLNPFAASIAHFRLLIAALKACGITSLRDAPNFEIDVVVGDSLLWGARPGQLDGLETAAAERSVFLYRTEHADALRRVFSKTYAAVVGNPPYIIARDKALNARYRLQYPKSCSGKYSLAAPFMERFFELAHQPDHVARPAGYVGMITANSFMKREFGKKLIEQCIPTWDLTHVVDTSGAYIPGHGTPTVILFGRHQHPVVPAIRTVMGIRGEPSSPADPAKGLVWSAIVDQIDHPGSESDYVSVSDVERERFAKHPWSIGGGGAAELKERLDGSASVVLGDRLLSVGFASFPGADDAFFANEQTFIRRGIDHRKPLVVGEVTRDWTERPDTTALTPYGDDFRPIQYDPDSTWGRYLWVNRVVLNSTISFGGQTRAEQGDEWWTWYRWIRDKYLSPLSIAFAFVATHNHFVLDRGGKVFKQSAPVIKLPAGASVDDHLGLVGLLNSSVACFWMQQVFHNKGRPGADSAAADEAWEFRFEHDGTKLKKFPLADGAWPLELARRLDTLATALAAVQPVALCRHSTPSRAILDGARNASDQMFAEMVALQEELDWSCLHLYGLTDESLSVSDGDAPPSLALGERAFEIVLARNVAAREVETAWFTRHRSTAITEISAHWPGWYRELVQRRIDLIESDRDVALVERPEHKRRWARARWEDLEATALRTWLADRLEERSLWFEGSAGADERATCRSVAQLADRVATDEDLMSVARLWKGRVEIDVVAVLAELVADEHVPAQAAARYKPSGMAKRAQWERTWALQRVEDRGEPLPDGLERIPVPPKYAPADFQRTSYWQQRGKLDVPKERLVSIAGAKRDTDSTMVLAWAGFDHAQLAQAVGTLIVEREQRDGWDADRVWPLVVALAEQLDWLDQWHDDIDPRWGASPAQLYRGVAEQKAFAGGRTLNDARAWRPDAPARGRRAQDRRAQSQASISEDPS